MPPGVLTIGHYGHSLCFIDFQRNAFQNFVLFIGKIDILDKDKRLCLDLVHIFILRVLQGWITFCLRTFFISKFFIRVWTTDPFITLFFGFLIVERERSLSWDKSILLLLSLLKGLMFMNISFDFAREGVTLTVDIVGFFTVLAGSSSPY